MSKKITALYERCAAPDPEYIRRQMCNLETFAQSQGFTNLQHFTDDGYSAHNYDRPGFKALWAQMQLGKIGTIIVTDMARLFRNMLANSTFHDILQKKGIRLIAITEKMDFLPDHIHDDDNGLDYVLQGDYYLPVIFDPDLEDHRPLGKWGMMYSDYLKNHRPGFYAALLLGGKLHKHLADLDEQARERHELIVKQMAQAEGINDYLKRTDQMAWVRRMNNIAARADEIIKAELIFI